MPVLYPEDAGHQRKTHIIFFVIKHSPLANKLLIQTNNKFSNSKARVRISNLGRYIFMRPILLSLSRNNGFCQGSPAKQTGIIAQFSTYHCKSFAD